MEEDKTEKMKSSSEIEEEICEMSNEQNLPRHSSRTTAGIPPKIFVDEFVYHHYAFQMGQIDEPVTMQ